MKIIIADDHPLIANGFMNSIQKQFPLSICKAARHLAELNSLLLEELPDILFQDIRFGSNDARDFIRPILEKYPSLRIIIISSLDDSDTIKTLLKQGVQGYILKSDKEEEIFRAIESVADGNIYISSEIKKYYAERELLFNRQYIDLTSREKQVLELIGDEYSTKEIAGKLSLSEKSIENYRSGLLLKFGAKNVAGLVKKALLEGFL